MQSLIEANATKLRELNEAIHTTFRERHRGKAEEERWKTACLQFHTSYDELAFPGGLAKAMQRLEEHNPTAIEMSVTFLEADPMFFRSGYIKEHILRHLRRAALNNNQQQRLRELILRRIYDKSNRRELRKYWRLGRFVSNPEFEQQLARLAISSGGRVSERAKLILQHISSKT